MPTEAQWEYACRAGTITALNNGTDLTSVGEDAAINAVGRYWYNGGSEYFQSDATGSVGTAFVGSYAPNAWGLYDFHGNVWEWCADWYGSSYYKNSPASDPAGPEYGTYRVLRGGSWNYAYAFYLRSASRDYSDPATNGIRSGFRVVLPAP